MGNRTKYHYVFGYYSLRPATPMPASQLSWSLYRELYKANLRAQILLFLQALFPIPPIILFSFSPVPLPFYPTTPVTSPTIAPIAVLIRAFVKAPIVTPATAAPATTPSISIVLTTAPVAPVVQLAGQPLSQNLIMAVIA